MQATNKTFSFSLLIAKAKTLLDTPGHLLPLIVALFRGLLYMLYYRLARPNVHIRFPFFVYQKVRITGPGSVFIDRFCAVYPNLFEGLTIETLTPTAKVSIGQNCALGGLTIRCRDHVTLGERCLTANSLIQDCLFLHPGKVTSKSIDHLALVPAPVKIGDNAWVAAQCCLLTGSRLGMDSVVALGANVYQDEVKEFHLASGNPLGRPVPISSVLRLTRLRS